MERATREVRKNSRAIFWLKLAVSLALSPAGLTTTGFAQTVSPNDPAGADKQPVAKAGIDIRVLAHTDATLSLPDLKSKFNLAIAEIAADKPTTGVDGIEVQDLTEEEFKIAERVFSGAIGMKKPHRIGQYLERNSKNTNEWLVKLSSIDDELVSFELTYLEAKDGQPVTKTFKPAARDAVPNDEANRLRFLNPGEYVFIVDPAWKPKEYSLEIRSGTKPPETTKKEKWPMDKYYLVQLRNYQGDLYELWDKLASDAIGNPLKDIRAERGMVALADWVTVKTGIGLWENDNFYRVNFSKLPGKKISNVWMLFPLSKAEADRVEAELNAYAAEHSAEDLANAIASDSGFAGFKSSRALDSEPTVLKPNDPPLWYQIPPKGTVTADTGTAPLAVNDPALQNGATNSNVRIESFDRTFKVENKSNWIQDNRVEKSWQIVCYEFTTPKTGRRLILNVENRLFQKADSENWADGLKQEKGTAEAEGK